MKTACEEEMTMPTIKQIDAAHEAIRPFSESLYSVLAPIFAAARRGVEAEQEIARLKMLNDGHQRLATQYRERAERAEAANVKLVGAIDMIRETLHGGNVQDLLLIINNALDEARNV
jgi:hypothetical protein